MCLHERLDTPDEPFVVHVKPSDDTIEPDSPTVEKIPNSDDHSTALHVVVLSTPLNPLLVHVIPSVVVTTRLVLPLDDTATPLVNSDDHATPVYALDIDGFVAVV